MLYFLIRPVVRAAFQVFYRKIWITGLDKVPKGVPLILTANHPTAFVDPCFLACFSGRTLHFMTRGDVFVNRFVRFLLDQVHLIPIYRFHDGYANLRRNESSFARAREVLARQGAVLVMAEGRLVHEKRLRPIQKGAARIGFEAMQMHGLPDVWVQPVALNYTRADRGRSELMADFGDAFPLSEYRQQYDSDQRAALAEVTDRIERGLKERVVQLPHGPDEKRLDLLLDMRRNGEMVSSLPLRIADRSRLERELELVETYQALSDDQREAWRSEIDRYASALERLGISDEAVVIGSSMEGVSAGIRIAAGLQPLFFLPHALPVVLARSLTDRMVRSADFRSSVLLGIATFSWLFWTGLLLVGLVWLEGWTLVPAFLGCWSLSAALLVPLTACKEREKLYGRYRRLRQEEKTELADRRELVWKTL